MAEAEILERLVSLNRARADEEARGVIRYLRPAFQRPGAPAQSGLDPPPAGIPHQPSAISHHPLTLPWPETLAEQIALVRGVIARSGWRPADGAKALARHFSGVRAPTLQRLIDALTALGQV